MASAGHTADTEGPSTEGSGAHLGPVTVVIADDHGIWRSGIRSELGENFTVVGEASDAREAIEVIDDRRPQLVLCDLHMPEGGGLAVARQCGGTTNVVMLTVSEAERDLLDAIAAGAVGYLIKSTPAQELRNELWRAAQGEPVFSPSLAALVLSEFRRIHAAVPDGQSLTPREREVLRHVAKGHTYKRIGEDLHIADKTVENHVRNILDKLHLSRKQELMRYAIEHGIE